MNENSNTPNNVNGNNFATEPATASCDTCLVAKSVGALLCPKYGHKLIEESNTPSPANGNPGVNTCESLQSQCSNPSSIVNNITEVNHPEPKPMANNISKEFELQPQCNTPSLNNPSPYNNISVPDAKPTAESIPSYELTCSCKDGTRITADVCQNTILIGSANDCDIQVTNDPCLSRKHAKITCENDILEITDLGSTNGTYVKIAGPVQLSRGDVILMGTSLLSIE